MSVFCGRYVRIEWATPIDVGAGEDKQVDYRVLGYLKRDQLFDRTLLDRIDCLVLNVGGLDYGRELEMMHTWKGWEITDDCDLKEVMEHLAKNKKTIDLVRVFDADPYFLLDAWSVKEVHMVGECESGERQVESFRLHYGRRMQGVGPIRFYSDSCEYEADPGEQIYLVSLYRPTPFSCPNENNGEKYAPFFTSYYSESVMDGKTELSGLSMDILGADYCTDKYDWYGKEVIGHQGLERLIERMKVNRVILSSVHIEKDILDENVMMKLAQYAKEINFGESYPEEKKQRILQNHYRLECEPILELALWKKKINSGVDADRSKKLRLDRDQSLVTCGKSVVLPMVRAFFGYGTSPKKN